MKQIYLIALLFFTSIGFSQDERLLGHWSLESIFDMDILLENPENPITINFNGTLNRINVNSFCGNTYQSLYTPSTSDNSIAINQSSWDFNGCNEDNESWEVAIANLLENNDNNPKTLTYTITQNGDIELLELNFSYTVEGTPTGTIGFFSRVLPPSNLLVNWYLHSLNTDDVQHDNYIGEIALEFTNESAGFQDYFTAIGGTPCQFNASSYKITNTNSLYFEGFVESASCGGDVDAAYTQKYLNVLSHDSMYSADLTYEIVEINDSSQLTLTNTFGDFAVFKTYPPESSNTLFKTWYSYSTETDNGIVYPLPNDPPSLTISKSTGFLVYEVEGYGGCNEFDADHNIYVSNENEFSLSFFNQTLVVCEDNEYEPIYFSVLNDENNNPFSYELQDDGNTLVLTNTIGDILTFGSFPPPVNMLGEWYLHYLVIDSNQVNNPSELATTINFETTPNGNGFYFDGFAICTGYGGGYYFNPQQTFDIAQLVTTLGDPCDTAEENNFESLYFYSVLATDEVEELNYEIIGVGNDAILIVTNLSNGNQAFYGRQALSVNEFSFENLNIRLIENPVKNNLNLSINQFESNLTYQIYSIEGKLIKESVLSSESINVEELNSGLYFIRFSNDETQTQTIKFIKQ